MALTLDQWHQGQFFVGKVSFTTSKKIQVLSLSGNDASKGEFLLYHQTSTDSDFEPIVSSKPFEVILSRKNQKISFQTKLENGNHYLYLNGKRVYYHPIHLNNLLLSHDSPAILHDGTFYEVSHDFAKMYNSTHFSSSTSDLVSQILQSNKTEEVQESVVEVSFDQIEVKEITSEEPIQESTIEVSFDQVKETEVSFDKIYETEITSEEPIQESHVEVSFDQVKETEVTSEEPIQESPVEVSFDQVKETEVSFDKIYETEITSEEPIQESTIEVSFDQVEETEVSFDQIYETEITSEEPIQESHVEVSFDQIEESEITSEEPIQECPVEVSFDQVEESSVEIAEEIKMPKRVSFEDSYEEAKQEIEREKKDLDELKNSNFMQIMNDFEKLQIEEDTPKPTVHLIEFQHQNKNYKMPCMKLNSSTNLNFKNIFANVVSSSNMIQKPNMAMVIQEMNKYYLVQHMNVKYLFYRNPQMLIITQIQNRQSRVIKNKDIFKLGPFDYLLTNQASMIVPMEPKKYFDNHYGTTFQTFMPRV
jgi:hypothetical protein